ncbi:MAG TPA: FAD-binding oxidoreductase [Terriglobia bacterium]|nr:FAD-binding oxidoreductase [Terriglobia bacterium]
MTDRKPSFAPERLSGWGRYPVETCYVFRPEKRSEVAATLASGLQTSYIPRGLGRSYGDAALNENAGVIWPILLNRFLSFDSASGVLECESGVSLAEIIQFFLPRGWFLPVTPGTKYVTAGGAIAADIHGKNHHRDGSFSNFVLDFRLLAPTGEVLLCSPAAHSEIFWATVGGMGLTGVVMSARLRLRRVDSAYVFVDFFKAANLEDALATMDASDERYEYSVAWIDALATGKTMGRSVLMRGNHAPEAELPARLRGPQSGMQDPQSGMRNPQSGIGNDSSIPTRPQWNLFMDFPSWALDRLTVQAFNTAYYAVHRTASRQLVGFEKFFYPLDAISQWNRMYGKRGFVQYQIALPQVSGRAGLRTILDRLARSGRASFLAVLKRFGDAGNGLLSFPLRGYTLALDIPAARGLVPFLHELDRMTLDHGGRIYLAKDAVLRAEDFAAMYPKLESFRAIQRKLDAQRLFSSSMARRLRIVD